MYQPSADFSGRFRLKCKPCKTFDVVVCTISGFFNFDFGGLQPGSTPPTPPPPLSPCWIRSWFMSWHFPVIREAIKTCRSVSRLRMEPRYHVNTTQQLHALTLMFSHAGKANPVQVWAGPGGSRRLRLPDFKTIGTWKLVRSGLCTGRLDPPRNIAGTQFCEKL